MRRTLARTVIVGLLIAVVAGGYLLFFAAPTVPSTAATTAVAHIAPVPGEPEVPEGQVLPSSLIYGSDCLDRLERPGGWADVCWGAHILTNGVDPRDEPGTDYYVLQVRAKFSRTSASTLGIRWLVLEARLQGEPEGGFFDGWPSGRYAGPCDYVEVSMLAPLRPFAKANTCGNTTGSLAAAPWSYRATWTCGPCLPFDDTRREITLFAEVGVPNGTAPVWDLYADFGT